MSTYVKRSRTPVTPRGLIAGEDGSYPEELLLSSDRDQHMVAPLLTDLATLLRWDVNISPVHEPETDRSLDSTAFRKRTLWTRPSWDVMLGCLGSL